MSKYAALVSLLVSALMFAQQPKGKPARISCPPVGPVKVVKMVKPAYPEEARRTTTFGTVTVELVIDKQGLARNVRVVKGEPVLTNAVLAVIPKWRWKPYKLNGEIVEVESTLTVNFEPR